MKKWYTSLWFLGLLGGLAYLSDVAKIPIGMIIFGISILILGFIRWRDKPKVKWEKSPGIIKSFISVMKE